jgi:hypothetical protein
MVGALVVLVVMFSFKGCGGPGDSTDKYAVQGTCQDIVKKQLKNPTTADFSSKAQGDTYASGMVTAENSRSSRQRGPRRQ